MIDPDDRQALIADQTCLGEYGLHLAWCSAPDGHLWPWVIRRGANAPDGCDCPRCAPHEQLGAYPLPGLALCGEPTTTGRPCQRWVDGQGPCWQHRRLAGLSDQPRRTDREDRP